MEILNEALGNSVMVGCALSWLAAQGAKLILELVNGDFSLKRLTGAGGMPSSHSATVASLAMGTALREGIGSTEFTIAIILAFIVVFDARGVRYVTGQQSEVLNRMRKRDLEEGKQPCADYDLEEQVGHKTLELIAGILIGIVVPLILKATVYR